MQDCEKILVLNLNYYKGMNTTLFYKNTIIFTSHFCSAELQFNTRCLCCCCCFVYNFYFDRNLYFVNMDTLPINTYCRTIEMKQRKWSMVKCIFTNIVKCNTPIFYFDSGFEPLIPSMYGYSRKFFFVFSYRHCPIPAGCCLYILAFNLALKVNLCL